MFCNNCGAKLADGAGFCTNCGKPVSTAPTQAPKPAPSVFASAPDLADTTFRPRQSAPAPTPRKSTGSVQVYYSPTKRSPAPASEENGGEAAPQAAVETPPVAAPAPAPVQHAEASVYARPAAPAYPTEAPAAASVWPAESAPADPRFPGQKAPATAKTPPVTAPIPPKKKKKGVNWVLIIVLLLIAALVGTVVWGFVDGWLPDMFSGSETDKDDKDDDDEDDPYAGWNDHQIGSLTIYLPEEFEEDHIGSNSAIFYSDDVEIEIEFGSMDDLPDDIRTAEEMADFYVDRLEDDGDEVIEHDTQNGVPYVIFSREDDPEDVMVLGFYSDGETGWILCAENFDPDQAEEMVPYVTSGEIRNSSENRDEDDRDNDNREEHVAETRPTAPAEEYYDGFYAECNGMTFNLYDYFEEDYNEDTYASYYNDVMNVYISSGDVDDIGEDIDNSRELAEYYAEGMDNVEFGKQNGITYITILEDDYDSGEAVGFYVEGDTGWMIRVQAADFYEYEDEIIDIVTSGRLD